jgi:hypothetical protein
MWKRESMKIVAALGDNSWLFSLTGGVLVPIADLRIPAVDDWIRIDGGIAAIIFGEPSVFLIEHEDSEVRIDILRLPGGADPRSIAVWND